MFISDNKEMLLINIINFYNFADGIYTKYGRKSFLSKIFRMKLHETVE